MSARKAKGMPSPQRARNARRARSAGSTGPVRRRGTVWSVGPARRTGTVQGARPAHRADLVRGVGTAQDGGTPRISVPAQDTAQATLPAQVASPETVLTETGPTETDPEAATPAPISGPDPGLGPDPGTGTRAAVHRDAANPLGASHPRQEGPADLRLVPPALAVWGTAALMLDAPKGWAIGVVAASLLMAVALLVTSRAGRGAPRAVRTASSGTAGRLRWGRGGAAAVLLCVAASGASAALHGADLHRGPVPTLARQYAQVTLDLDVTSDPRRTRPRVTGDHMAPTALVLDATVVRLTTTDTATRTAMRKSPYPSTHTTTWTTRAPVLVIADAPASAPVSASAPTQAGDATGDNDGDGGRDRNGDAPMGRSRPAEGDAPAVSSWEGMVPGTRLRVRARLAPPFSGDGRIAAVVRVTGDETPRVVRAPSGPQRLAGRLRDGLRTATQHLAPDARALLPGLVVGDTSRVPSDLDDAFDATDLTHVLAVSGANFTILLALLIGPPGLAHRAERRGLAPRLGIGLRTTALLGGALTLGFVLVCRPGPSVLRAAACGGIVLLAIATGRRRSLVPALAAVVLLLVLYDPWLSRSYGFLLSVLATGALLTLAPRWGIALRARGLPPRLAEPLAAAAAAQVVCAPVVVVLASRVSLVAVPCNLLAEFAIGPATVLGFGALVTAPVVMPLARVFAWCAGWPAGWLAAIARTGAALPGSGVDWPGGWRGGLLLAAATAVVVVAGRRLVRHPWVCLVCVCGLLLFVLQPAPLPRILTGWPPPGWRLVMCDVGQGDALVLAAGDGSGVVVDAGPDPALADHCLRSLGITRVRLVLLTHFHADHVAGLIGVLRGRQVGGIETTGFGEPADQAAFVRRIAAARHIPVTRAVAGERRRAGDLDWQVLWPPAGPSPGPDDPNDASVALLVRTGGLRFLLLGDLEPPAQQALLRSPAGAELARVDVLKVAHHGSAYQDPQLLRTVAPRLALISCGTDNPYGHPSARTVAALRSGGARVLRTDRDGSLAVTGTAAKGLGVAESPASPW